MRNDRFKVALLAALVIASLSVPMLTSTSTKAQVTWTGTATFSLEGLYAVSLDANLWLGEGSKLVVRFYTYADSYQGENIVWSGTTPDNVSFSKTVPHPQGASYPQGVPVEKVELVLTDGAGAEIDTIAAFTVTRDVLYAEIVREHMIWPFLPPGKRDSAFAELSDKMLQWPFAPT